MTRNEDRDVLYTIDANTYGAGSAAVKLAEVLKHEITRNEEAHAGHREADHLIGKRVDEVDTKLESLRNSRDAHAHDLTKAEAEIRSLEDRLDKERDSLRRSIADRDGQITALDRSIANMTRDRDEWRKSSETWQRKFGAEHGEWQKMRDERDAANTAAARAARHLEEAHRTIAPLEITNAQLAAEVNGARRDHAAIVAERDVHLAAARRIPTLERELAEERSRSSALVKRIEGFAKSLIGS